VRIDAKRRHPSIAVVGSLNMDIVVEVPRMPAAGETLRGRDAAFHPGGKGANQAVAAARLGADVGLYGKVGDDPFGGRLLGSVRGSGVDVRSVEVEGDRMSGLASIWVDGAGENAIALAAGANGRVNAEYITRHLDRIAEADVLLLQLEIPIESVDFLLSKLPATRPRIILDPAPAQDLSALPLSRIDILTPNEAELRVVSGENDLDAGARRLLGAGIGNVVCTLGAEGAIWYAAEGSIARFPAPKVAVVDTTAAGDAFNGALASTLVGRPLGKAIPFAVAAGALATTVRGAQPSLPTREALGAFLRRGDRGRSGPAGS
jgi:ribokinase